MDIFEAAARSKLRFSTPIGEIGAEDLFDLPLVSKTGRVSLDALAVTLDTKIRSAGIVSFVEPGKQTDAIDQLRFEIVKHVIDIKLAENKKAAEARENAAKKERIREILAERNDSALKSKTNEELQTLLAAL